MYAYKLRKKPVDWWRNENARKTGNGVDVFEGRISRVDGSGDGCHENSSKFPGIFLEISRNRGCVCDLQNDIIV